MANNCTQCTKCDAFEWPTDWWFFYHNILAQLSESLSDR